MRPLAPRHIAPRSDGKAPSMIEHDRGRIDNRCIIFGREVLGPASKQASDVTNGKQSEDRRRSGDPLRPVTLSRPNPDLYGLEAT